MAQHIHYDLAAFEKQLRADVAALQPPVDEFERLQRLGSEVMIQFSLFLVRTDNEGVDDQMQAHAGAAIIATLIENMATSYDGDRDEIVAQLLQVVANFAKRGGEVLHVTDVPVVQSGTA